MFGIEASPPSRLNPPIAEGIHLLLLAIPFIRRWQQQSTTGTPPLGVWGYACSAIGNKIYYFGGWCNHDQCNHNSLHELDTDGFKWRECLASSDSGPLKKASCGMVAFQETLLVIGGVGILSPNRQPWAHYDERELPEGIASTNEQHMHVLGTGEQIPLIMFCQVSLT